MKRIIILILTTIFPIVAMSQSVEEPASVVDSLAMAQPVEEPTSVVDSLKHRCDSLQNALDALLPLREREADKLLGKYGVYFEKRFSEIDEAVADSLYRECRILNLPSLEKFASMKDVVIERKHWYDSLTRIVEKPYNKKEVTRGIVIADSLAKLSPRFQKSEFDSVSSSMKGYPTSITKTKEVVEFIHEMMEMYRPNGGHSGAVSTLNSILNNERDNINNYINKVPYLKRRFNEMVASLKKNHLVQSDAEKELLKL